jgi:Tol biopolymer transport system component
MYRLLLLTLVLPFVGAADLGRAQGFHVDIVAVDLSGRQTNLTQSASFNASPAAARDGRVAFVSDRDGVPNLYVMDADGGNVRRLNGAGPVVGDNDVLEVSEVAWSPRGGRIAFDSQYAVEPNCSQHCANWDALVIGSDGSGLEQIALAAREAAWSPEGGRLAYLSGVSDYEEQASGVTITRLDGSRSIVVKALNQDANKSDSGPVWSPSGDALAFEARRARNGRPWVYIVRADGRGKRPLAAGHDPSWSTNGKHLAFIDGCKLMTIDRSGKGERSLSRKGECVEAAAWSPKGPLLAYLSTTTPGAGPGLAQLLRVETVSADGRRVRVLARPPSGIEVIWSGPVWTHDGKRILIAVG